MLQFSAATGRADAAKALMECGADPLATCIVKLHVR